MDYKSTKNLAAYAAGVQFIAVVITYLLYANQETVKSFFSATEEIIRVRSIPVSYFIVSICPAVFYSLYMGFQVFTKGKGGSKKAGAILFFVLGCVIGIVLEFVPRVESMLIGTKGVSALASYSVLSSASSLCIRPFSIVAFGLFALSAGGNLFADAAAGKQDDHKNGYDSYYGEWGN